MMTKMVQKVKNEKYRKNDKDGVSYSLDKNSLYFVYHVKK